MKKLTLAFIVTIPILLSFISCNKFDVSKEKNNIDELIQNQKLDYISYHKKYNDNSLYTGEAIINTIEDTPEYSYTVWYQNNHILKIYITNADSENGGVQENYYFKPNGDVFCYQYLNVSFPNGINGNRATFFLDEDNSIKEIYEINQGENIFNVTDKKTFNQENFGHPIVYYKNLTEIISFYNLQECLNKVNQTSSIGSVNNNETKEKTNSESKKTISEIRSLIISGTKQNMIRQLGNANEEYSSDDFMEKYYNWKAFSVYSAQRLLYSQVFLYENIDNTGKTILVVYSFHNGKVYEVMYKDDLKSYEDLSVNFGND